VSKIYFVLGAVLFISAIFVLQSVSAALGGSGLYEERVEVSENSVARVACANTGEVIQTIEAYYYCSNNVQQGIYCTLPESQIINRLSSYSFTFSNTNCGFDPCQHVEKKGILLIECSPARASSSGSSQTANTQSPTNTQTSSAQTSQTGNSNSGGFVGFIREILSGISSILGSDSNQPGTSSQESSTLTEEDIIVNAVLENDLVTIKSASKPLSMLAIDQYAVQNKDISVCEEGTPECAQKTLFFACSEAGNKERCEFDLINDMRRVDDLNAAQGDNTFENGKRIYIRYGETESQSKVKRFKFENAEVRSGICEIRVQKDSTDGSHYGYYEYLEGTVVPSRAARLDGRSNEVRATDVLSQGFSKIFPWEISRDCNSRDCALLDGGVVAPKGDLLCGPDERWYLCDGFGVQNFNNGEQYFCDNGVWKRVKQSYEV